MKKKHLSLLMAFIALSTALKATSAATDVKLVDKGKTQSAIYVAPDVMAENKTLPGTATHTENQAETDRQRLRESVKDLAHYLQKMSGARIEVLTSSPQPKDKRVPIFIGTLATQRFPGVLPKAPAKQGFRVVVSGKGVGLMGESGEATSYAIYEVLDRLGCRWYMPSEMGEVIPRRATISLPVMDFAGRPGTLLRQIWYVDENFKRRNRAGGPWVYAQHALEYYITKEQREQNPDWRAIINGKPSDLRLKWSHPGVQQAVADAIIKKLDAKYEPSVSISPEDGISFDESDDRAWDAGDWDPTTDQVSITDRYIKFCNIVIEKVTKKYPDVLFGALAYVQYTRPPVREKPHPNLVPQIAPITYCRAHAMTDTHICPSRPQIRPIVEGWGKVAKQVSYYNYMFHLAEVTVPYPMIHQMKEELPILYRNNVQLWQPESMPVYESILPGAVLTTRKSWYPQANSDAILNEFYTGFYGSASPQMRTYWQFFDQVWIKHPAHAGSGFSYVNRFTPKVMQEARRIMNAALAATRTPMEYRRVQIQDEALRQFERMMQLRWDLNEGRLTNLDIRNTEWLGTQLGLGNEYAAQSSFSKAYWTPYTIGGWYHKSFFEASYIEGARIARDFNIITSPLRQWLYAVDKEKSGEQQGWHRADFDASGWKATDVGVETWSDLDLMDYMGVVWYRQNVLLPAVPAGKKVYLWLSSTDGDVKVFVNGQPIPYVNAQGQSSDLFSGFAQPASFDITSAIKPGAGNQISISINRNVLNELGTGGLLAPHYLYMDK